MKTQERAALVDDCGTLLGFSPNGSIPHGAIGAVELTLMYSQETKTIILINRGQGASDMRGRWALQSGKVLKADLSADDWVGSTLSLAAYRKAAVREFAEEAALTVDEIELAFVDRFFMQHGVKRLFFTLLSLPMTNPQLSLLSPNQSEVERFGAFTLPEFHAARDLGDAIIFRREAILDHLNKVFFRGESR